MQKIVLDCREQPLSYKASPSADGAFVDVVFTDVIAAGPQGAVPGVALAVTLPVGDWEALVRQAAGAPAILTAKNLGVSVNGRAS